MDEKMTAAEQAFEEWFKTAYPYIPVPQAGTAERIAYLAADARATERTARRCVELADQYAAEMNRLGSDAYDTRKVTHAEMQCERVYGAKDVARAIAKEFGLD